MNTLRKERIKHGLGLIEAAKLIGMDPGNLSRIERGRQTPSIRRARLLADFYGLTLDEIFREPEQTA